MTIDHFVSNERPRRSTGAAFRILENAMNPTREEIDIDAIFEEVEEWGRIYDAIRRGNRKPMAAFIDARRREFEAQSRAHSNVTKSSSVAKLTN